MVVERLLLFRVLIFLHCIRRYLMINYWRFLMNWLIFVSREGICNSYLLVVTVINGKEKECQEQQLLLKALRKRLWNIFYKIVTLNLRTGNPGKLLELKWLWTSSWILRLRKSEIRCGREFFNVFRFISHLTAINDWVLTALLTLNPKRRE